jgi:hypothetical protein
MKSNRKFIAMVSSIKSNSCKTSVSVCLIMKLIYQFIFIIVVFYSRIIAIARSVQLRHSPSARDNKLTTQVIATIIRSLNNILFFN